MFEASGHSRDLRWPILEYPLPEASRPQLRRELEDCGIHDWVLAESIPYWHPEKGAKLFARPQGLPWVFAFSRCITSDGSIHLVWLRSS